MGFWINSPSSRGTKMAERIRRGKLQKARSGKVVGGHPVNYGFRMNAVRDAYEVDAPKMSVVWRIFRLIGEERLAITAVCEPELAPLSTSRNCTHSEPTFRALLTRGASEIELALV
jgi:hypothetical protein